uniref:hypothetical protein n=1 Tax=Streptosporangium sp. CA-256172 TaxID=3240076 RepID=UPI003F4918EF
MELSTKATVLIISIFLGVITSVITFYEDKSVAKAILAGLAVTLVSLASFAAFSQL